MITVVEDYLQDLLKEKFNLLKTSPDRIDKILMMNSDKKGNLKTFIQNNTINIIKGYPRVSAELPCICILLSEDSETQEGIGDYCFEDKGDVLETSEEGIIELDPSISPSPIFKLKQKPVTQILEILNNSKGIIIPPSEYSLLFPDRGILGFFSGNGEVLDDLSITYEYSEVSPENVQTQFDVNFRVEVWGNNADLVVQLYYLVKWVLLMGRGDLITNIGLYRQRLSGSDFQPAPNFMPEFVYRRAITFWCQLTVSAPVSEAIYISDIEVNQTIIN